LGNGRPYDGGVDGIDIHRGGGRSANVTACQDQGGSNDDDDHLPRVFSNEHNCYLHGVFLIEESSDGFVSQPFFISFFYSTIISK
jgi:hypothetical protein